VVVDGQGLLVHLSLTARQSHDGLLCHVDAGAIVLADKAYDDDRIWTSLRENAALASIPSRANRRSRPYFSTWHFRERDLIGWFFSKLKHFRRVATCHDKLAESYLVMVQLASMCLWLRVYQATVWQSWVSTTSYLWVLDQWTGGHITSVR
jgi:transposase